jgi:hypothetical protein
MDYFPSRRAQSAFLAQTSRLQFAISSELQGLVLCSNLDMVYHGVFLY